MRFLRSTLFAVALFAAGGVSTFVASDAHASVSIAVVFDALVKDADAVAVVTPVESKSVWEDGRIYTYTRVKSDQGVAGDLGTGGEAWVRTMGGVVGKIGQLVDGEAVFTPGKSSMLFLHKFKQGGVWEVSARGQGQYPVVIDEAKLPSAKDATTLANAPKKLVRSATAGALLPPRTLPKDVQDLAAPAGAANPATTASPVAVDIRLASDVLHDRSLDEAAREVATAWKRLHPTQAK